MATFLFDILISIFMSNKHFILITTSLGSHSIGCGLCFIDPVWGYFFGVLFKMNILFSSEKEWTSDLKPFLLSVYGCVACDVSLVSTESCFVLY